MAMVAGVNAQKTAALQYIYSLPQEFNHNYWHRDSINYDCELCDSIVTEHNRVVKPSSLEGYESLEESQHRYRLIECPLCNKERKAKQIEKEVERLRHESGYYHSKKYGHWNYFFGYNGADLGCVVCRVEKLELGDKLWEKLLKERYKNWINSDEYKESQKQMKVAEKQLKKWKKEEKLRKEKIFRELLEE